MKSLFDKLLVTASTGEATPTEDFFTEIFAHVLDSSQVLLSDWVSTFKISEIEPQGHYVRTQLPFHALKTHPYDSRPDIYIELYDDDHKDIVLIESKISSSEGEDQLRRYAEHLDNLSEFDLDHAKLVYITRDFDEKDKSQITGGCHNLSESDFIPIRWHQIYRFLKKHEGDPLLREVTRFMEVNNMALTNQFSALDILALTNFPRVRKMMDETMHGQVHKVFKTTFKSISQHSVCLTQLRDQNRYIYYSNQEEDMWCGFGYWFDPSIIINYPKVGVILEISPSSKERRRFLIAMKGIVGSNPERWEGYDLASAKKWSGIRQLKSVRDFMPREDHIKSISEFFLKAIGDVEGIKDKHPDLPWKK